ncbi:hypothetical protein TNCV_3922291 [Trichonephila clavipes]|nr:hypothetical protein TNCV_3922291 [Trichonephila clavipes]
MRVTETARDTKVECTIPTIPPVGYQRGVGRGCDREATVLHEFVKDGTDGDVPFTFNVDRSVFQGVGCNIQNMVRDGALDQYGRSSPTMGQPVVPVGFVVGDV